MTRPATLPELLAQGKVKPGDWVECVTTDDPDEYLYRPGGRYQIRDDGDDVYFWGEKNYRNCAGTEGTFRPVKPAKAKKWLGWVKSKGEARLIDFMANPGSEMQVKRTKDGSLMIRYRRKG